jgi:hypothetical protein
LHNAKLSDVCSSPNTIDMLQIGRVGCVVLANRDPELRYSGRAQCDIATFR